MFENVIQSWIFSIITPVFSVTWFFRNPSNDDLVKKKKSYYYDQCWKQLCCL